MNIKENANEIDSNLEKIKALYYSTEKNEENEDKRRVLIAQASFIWHSIDLNKNLPQSKESAATITRQYEIIAQCSALFLELNNLLIK